MGMTGWTLDRYNEVDIYKYTYMTGWMGTIRWMDAIDWMRIGNDRLDGYNRLDVLDR